jgi:hypothetical protein
MNNLRTRLALITVAFAVAGCQSNQQVLAGSQSQAMDVAVKRGQFELNCPAATGSVLSSQMAQPVVDGPILHGPERAEYTIGVSGCNQRKTYVVICPQDGSGGCFAAEGDR